MPSEDTGPIPPEKIETYVRLGVVEGKIDTLLRLREEDGSNLRGLAADIKQTVGRIHDENGQLAARVIELAAVAQAFRAELSTLDQMVRGGDQALMNRMTKVEQDLGHLGARVGEDRRAVADDIDGLKEQLSGDIRNLRTEVRDFAATAATRESLAAAEAAAAAKEQKAHNRNVMLTVAGIFLTALLGLAAAAIQGAFSNHWK